MQNTPLATSLVDFHLAPITKKNDPRYGAIMAQKIIDAVKAHNGYFEQRNRRFDENHRFATGQHSMKEFLDYLNIDGKQSFINLNMEPPKFAPKFFEVLTGRFMERSEKPTVSAVDEVSLRKIQSKKDRAEFRMKMSGLISQIQEASGVPVEDPSAYTPEDEDDLEFQFEVEERLPEVTKFEKAIEDALKDSGQEVFKRQILTDLEQRGIGIAYVYRDANGNKKYRRVIPSNCVYSYSNFDDFRDCKMIGELEKMRVSDAREYYPELKEEQIYKMVTTSNQDPKFHNLQWDSSWCSSLIRPYDDAIIEIFCFTLISTEDKYWVESKDRYGRKTFDEKQSRPMYVDKAGNLIKPEGKEVVEKKVQVVYKGVYATSIREMLSWGIMQDMIKPHYALHEVFGPFAIIMPSNDDMTNVPPAERIKNDIRELTLVRLKLQQLIAKMKPDGVAIDINGLSNVDLGLGKTENALSLQAVYDQTGIIYYNGRDAEGNPMPPPITPTENNNIAPTIQTLISVYNFYLQSLRDSLGTNEIVEGQAPNPKLGKGVMQGSENLSNRATNFLYDAYINLLEQIAKRFAVMEWYDIVDGRREKKYNLKKEDVLDSIFDLKISMLPTAEEQQYVETLTSSAITAQLITFEEGFKVRRLAKISTLQAERYLSRCERKRQEQKAKEAQQNTMFAAQSQQQSNQQTHDNALQLEQVKSNGAISLQDKINEGKKNEFIQNLITESLKDGFQIPPAFMSLVQQYLGNAQGSQQLQSIDQAITMQGIQQQMGQDQGGEEQPKTTAA